MRASHRPACPLTPRYLDLPREKAALLRRTYAIISSCSELTISQQILVSYLDLPQDKAALSRRTYGIMHFCNESTTSQQMPVVAWTCHEEGCAPAPYMCDDVILQ